MSRVVEFDIEEEQLLNAITVVTAGVFGLLVGSFLNVVIYRLPRQCLSIVRDTRSRCPRCGVTFSWYDNVPIASYVFLRGRCRSCRGVISARYPLVEAGTAAAFAGLAWFDLVRVEGVIDGSRWAVFAVHATVVAVLLALSVIDLDYRILPDAITLPGIVIAPIMVGLVPDVMPTPRWLSSSGHLSTVAESLLGIAVGGGSLWLIGRLGELAFRKPAMGLGDVKLAAGLGGLLGLWVVWAFFLACCGGAIIGLIVLLVRRDRYIPFGPFLALGAIVALLWGPDLFEAVTLRLAPR